jgi:hypothetical protein
MFDAMNDYRLSTSRVAAYMEPEDKPLIDVVVPAAL